MKKNYYSKLTLSLLIMALGTTSQLTWAQTLTINATAPRNECLQT
jgi:hypothetical protein